MCETALDAALTRRQSEEGAGSSIFVSSGLVPKASNVYNVHEFVTREFAPPEPTYHQDAGVRALGMDREAANWYREIYGVAHGDQEIPDNMPQRAEWIGDERFFLGEKKDGLSFRTVPGRFVELVVGPQRTKVARRKLSRDTEILRDSPKPLNDLINLLPDECLYEIFRSLSRARDRCNVGSVCRRWLTLLSHIPRSSLRCMAQNSGPSPNCQKSSKPQIELGREVGDSNVRGDRRLEGNQVVEPSSRSESRGDDRKVTKRRLNGRKATDTLVAAIAIGTAGSGGLGELEIGGDTGVNISRGVSNVGLTAIAMSSGALRKLTLWHCSQIGDEGLISIGGGCPLLERINLWKCPGIGNAGIQAIAEGCPLLNLVYLDSCKRIGNAALKAVGRSCSSLVSLGISNCEVGSEGIEAVVTSCLKLKKMKLDKIQINDTGLALVWKHSKSLSKLKLSNLKSVTEAGFLALSESSSVQELRDISVSACKGLSDKALEVVGENCRDLKLFSLLNCEAVSDMGLKALTKCCPSLESLHVEGCSGITHVGLKAALANRGGELRALRLSNCSGVRDKGLTSSDFLLTCNALKSLSITHCLGVGNGCLTMVGRSCPSLEQLDLSGLSAVSDRGLKAVIQGVGGNLKKLNLTGCIKVSDQGVCAVARHCSGNLQSLTLEGCTKVTDRSLKELLGCRGIEDLDLSKCGITDEGLVLMLSENGSCLKSLSLAGCKYITGKSASAVGKYCKRIEVLNMQHCQGVSHDALATLEMQMFNVDFIHS